MADFTGLDEQDFILDPVTGIGALAGGRVFEIQVPDNYKLPRDDDGVTLPYIVANFQSPFAMMSGRSIDGGEQNQPHMMALMITSTSGNPDWSKRTDAQVKRTLTGLRPSPTSGVLQAVGGFSYDTSDNGSRPTRFSVGSWFRVPINLGYIAPN